jgi:small GTP-binding protein
MDFWTIDAEVTDRSKLPPGTPESLKLQVWDTAGQERFQYIGTYYYRGANAAALVFSIDDPKSLAEIRVYVEQIQTHCQGCHLVLVGSKSDLASSSRKVSRHEATKLAAELRCKYVECSAKEGINVELVFEHLATKILQNWKEEAAIYAPPLPAQPEPGFFHRTFNWISSWWKNSPN